MKSLTFPPWLVAWLQKYWLVVAALGALVLRLVRIDNLPVFADEAIYIRWAQLLWHEWPRYVFLAMNDGKPPLFIWLLGAIMPLWPLEPVLLGRTIVAVLGIGQLLTTVAIVRAHGGKKPSQITAALLVALLPFWFWHQRLALMDTLLVLLLSLSYLLMVRSSQAQSIKWSQAALAGLCWGLALITKTPALFFSPIIFLYWTLWNQGYRKADHWLAGALQGGVGLGVLALLRFAPQFGSLWSRSGDFSFSISEVLSGQINQIPNNLLAAGGWLSAGLRPEIISLAILAAVIGTRKQQLTVWWLWLCAATLAGPLIILGAVLHARYFLIAAPFITIAAALTTDIIWPLLQKRDFNRDFLAALVGIFLLFGVMRFIIPAWTNLAIMPLPRSEREEYLMEWSAGFGNRETVDFLVQESQKQPVTVLTEGSFGSLPDGIHIYLDRHPNNNEIRIEGLAQYPVKFFPDWAEELIAQRPTYLAVNSHRLELSPADRDRLETVLHIERPFGGPSFFLFAIKPLDL